MQRFITPAVAVALSWLKTWWPLPGAKRRLAQNYARAIAEYPDVFGDIFRKGCWFDTVNCPGDSEQTQQNIGARDLVLHIKTMAKLSENDLRLIEEETDHE